MNIRLNRFGNGIKKTGHGVNARAVPLRTPEVTGFIKTMHFLRPLTLAAALLLPAGRAAAQTTVSFKLTPPAAQPRLAETFSLRLELICPAEYTVRPDTSTFSNSVFELLEIKKISSKTVGALKTETFELAVSAFAIGVSTFPETAWLLAAGAELKEAKSPAFTLEILPFFDAKKEPEGIRDILPPFKFIPWLGLLAAFTAAVLAAWFIYRRYKTRAGDSAGAETTDAPDLRSPYEKASDALARLSGSGLWEEGKIKEFYSRLSDIFRNYLDGQFGIKAELMTTNDITRELRNTGADIKTVIRTRELLENSDLVKFAKFKPGEKERDSAVSSLKDLLIFFTRQEENRRALAAAPKPGEGAGKT
ncbi:MAG: hypothetical protein A2270_05585 [Elusimicrobia bacterium RIFOXYA12_FULL_51_18]|nr:MAG: hypothetical protein A2270_05585 [Elusimicrobia bacterium RIFOXYA12_FULL_51_18]OGS28705.1 MAG: hypothetical protein A2218_11080 [Elusimicrobia bacterium RIFOXYA2_FULL_53_38]